MGVDPEILEELGHPMEVRQRWGTVLVVDDEKQVQTMVKHILEHFGFRVLTADDGQEGVKVFREHVSEIAVVLLDLAMPGLDGEAALEEILRLNPDARVVMMSGWGEAEIIERCSGKALAGVLQKPFNMKQLADKLHEVLKAKPC